MGKKIGLDWSSELGDRVAQFAKLGDSPWRAVLHPGETEIVIMKDFVKHTSSIRKSGVENCDTMLTRIQTFPGKWMARGPLSPYKVTPV